MASGEFSKFAGILTAIICQLTEILSEENYKHFLALSFFGIGTKTFSSPVANAEFSKFAGILSAALSQHRLSGLK